MKLTTLPHPVLFVLGALAAGLVMVVLGLVLCLFFRGK